MQPTLKTRGRPRKQNTESIANTLVEEMFLMSADTEEVQAYYRLLAIPVRGQGLATSYASKKAFKRFVEMTKQYS